MVGETCLTADRLEQSPFDTRSLDRVGRVVPVARALGSHVDQGGPGAAVAGEPPLELFEHDFVAPVG